MRFPNAFAGVKKIFTAEILEIIAAVCGVASFIALIVAVAGAAGASAEFDGAAGALIGGGLGFIVLGLGTAVLSIIATILTLVGLKKAGKDDANFNQGFVFAVLVLILTFASGVLSAIFGSAKAYDDIVTAVANFMKIFVTLYVIKGISSLADQLGDDRMVNKGRNIYIFYVILMFVSLALRIISPFLNGVSAISAGAGTLAIISGVASFIAYIVYLVYLGQAKKMLQRS